MIFFLTSHSLWLSGTILIGLGSLLSMLGPAVVRRYVTLERLTANNEIAGFKYAVLGVLYAVLLAFAIIVVWQKFSEAEASVVQEAGAATTIYRLSQGMGEKPAADIRAAVTTYLEAAIADDWPAMDRGVPSANASAAQGSRRDLRNAIAIRHRPERRQPGHVRNPVSARPDDAGAPREAYSRRRRRSRGHMARALRRAPS